LPPRGHAAPRDGRRGCEVAVVHVDVLEGAAADRHGVDGLRARAALTAATRGVSIGSARMLASALPVAVVVEHRRERDGADREPPDAEGAALPEVEPQHAVVRRVGHPLDLLLDGRDERERAVVLSGRM
jgi:hypothetical protein